MTDTGIKPNVLDEIKELAVKHSVDKVILFGSRARGDHHKKSDIDLAVLGGNADAFALDIEELTSTLLEYDVVNLNGTVQEELLDSIRREGRVLYEKI